MKRQDILQSPEYWTTNVQLKLYEMAERFMESHNMNRTQLASYLGVSKGYVTQLLNGDCDHKLSKIVELALAFGYEPDFNFKSNDMDVRDVSADSEISRTWVRPAYSDGFNIKAVAREPADLYIAPMPNLKSAV